MMPLRRATPGATASRQSTVRPSPDPHKRKRRQAARPVLQDQDVIELSSDDDDAPPPPPKKPRSKSKTPAPVNPEVLEISDFDDTPPKPTTSKPDIASVTQRYKRLKQENDRLKKQVYTQRKDIDATHRELHKAKRELSDNKKRLSKASNVSLDSLEEELQCEVCTMKMWSPFLLPECGHVFCQRCLTDWFSTTQAQHMNSHPHMIPLPPHFLHALRHPDGNAQLYLNARMFLVQNPLPKYSCPTCRKSVTRKPVEDYTLKKVVAWVAKAQNEHLPSTVAEIGAGGLWDGFFPL